MILISTQNESVHITITFDEAKKIATLLGMISGDDICDLIMSSEGDLYSDQYTPEDIDKTAYSLFDALTDTLDGEQQ